MQYYILWFLQVFIPVALILSIPTLIYLLDCRRHARRINLPHLLLNLALAGDILMTAILTLIRSYHLRDLQLHLFASWREAWITQTGFDQLFLNIGVFIPFGALLAMRFPRMRRLWKVGLAALSFSVLIELTQLLLARGVTDIDDLFSNTLGGILGCSIVSAAIHLRSNNRKDAILALLPLLIVCIACTCYCITSILSR